MGTRTGSVGRTLAVAAAVCGLASSLFVGQASAEPPDFLLQAPETQIEPGEGAGELDNPRGVATDPDNGHIFIADLNNARISEYSAWGLFVKSWGLGVADGSSEAQICGPAEPEADPDPALCQAGTPGDGKGQLNLPIGMAVDPSGNVYVFELGNLRVQKFSPAGQFLVMLGGDVNKTKAEEGAPAADRNRCPVDPGDICQAGVSGEGPSQLSGTIGDYIDYTPSGGGGIAVGDTGGIQIFNLDGTHRQTIAFTGGLATFAGLSVNALDLDESGNVFFSLSGSEDVFKISPAGVPLAPGKPGESKFEVHNPLGVAVDVEGSVYVIDNDPTPTVVPEVIVANFDSAGNRLLPTKAEEEAKEFFPYVPFLGPALTGLATNLCEGSEASGNLFVAFFRFGEVSHVNGYGTPPTGCEEPPVRPPVISGQYGISAGTDEATVKAQINPLFWADTTYYVEYGTGKCSEGGCDKAEPLPPGLDLTDQVVNALLPTVGVRLKGLAPDTVYHHRFVAQSSGGGPVFGIDPDGENEVQSASFEEGLEATFRTFAEPRLPEDCLNDFLRVGAGANLPDCRAYEMVSPLDKGNADVGLVSSPVAYFDERNQSALSGERFTYSSMTAFDDPEGAPSVSQYLAERGPLGWGGDPIAPPRTTPPISVEKGGLANEFHAFSSDLCSAWLRHNATAPLTPEAVVGFANLYRRDNCAEPRFFEALTTVEPPSRSPAEYFPLLVQGFASDVTHAIFTSDDKLHPDAPTLAHKELLLYEHVEGETRFVCYLPSGEPIAESCSAGTAAGHSGGTDSSLRNAISADGSRIFWTAYSGEIQSKLNHPGRIFVRIDGKETVAVSDSVANEPAFFWTAADDGSKAIFRVVGGAAKGLYEFDVDSETPTLIATGSPTPLGASEDASRIYFVSVEDLDAGGPASAGALNLYLHEESAGGAGSTEFVMALGGADVGGQDNRHAAASELPAVRSARVSPDGRFAVFTSNANPTPTGYDNLDATSGQPVAEVYRYDAETGELLCVSCNPTGIRPTGVDLGGVGQAFEVAARIQGWEFALHAPRVLSHDGSRVFFESHEALVPRDTNGAWDVYQWEAPGRGTCEEGDATFHASNGGCVDLISSGESPADSKFLDADPSGDNVFIATQSSLIGTDYGLNDVYVARVGGGFPEPSEPVECEGETCPTPRPPPPEATPPSMTEKPGNVIQAKPKPRPCPKGKRKVRRKGKVRCVPRKARKGAARRRGARR